MADLTPRLSSIQSQAANLIINGDMTLFQRGTTVNLSTTAQYIADRFSSYKTAGYTGTSTAAQSSDVPTVAQAGWQSRFSLLLTNGTALASPAAGDSYVGAEYRMEGQDYQVIHAQAFRLQFMVKTSIAGTYSISFRNSAQDRVYIATYVIAAGEVNTYVKRFVDLTADAAGTWLFDNTMGLRVSWTLSSGTTAQTSTVGAWQAGSFLAASSQVNWAGTTGATFRLAQVMLVPGEFVAAGSNNVDMSFRRAGKTIGDELRLCQRYLFRPEFVSGGVPYAPGFWFSTTDFRAILSLPVRMRVAPTYTYNVGTGLNILYAGAQNTVSSSSLSYAGSDSVNLNFATSAFGTAGQGAILVNNNQSATYLQFDSEL